MTKEIIIKASNVFKSYSIKSGVDTPVLKGITVALHKGEFTALTGASGVGKSTLLHLLGSLDVPDKGTIELCIDEEVFDYSKTSSELLAKIRNKHIGFIFQFHHLLPEFTAMENVMMPSLIAGESKKTARDKALELLNLVGMSHRAEHKPSEISGGEQQRIAIARALINEPALVLADEPTGNLDSANASAVMELIMQLRKKFATTFIVATHSSEVASKAERVIQMSDGKLL